MPRQTPTACLALANGTLFYGRGFGATGQTTAELCFNTAMTGYQEIMTDPSYAGQIVTFTFPHVGNTERSSRPKSARRFTKSSTGCCTPHGSEPHHAVNPG